MQHIFKLHFFSMQIEPLVDRELIF